MKRCEFHWVACGSCRHPAYMTNRSASLCPADFPSHTGILRHPDAGVILFDTGYDPAFLKATQPFPELLYRWVTPVTLGDNIIDALAARGLKPDDVQGIVLSHFHGDHVAGLHHFPNARIFCSQAGLMQLRKQGRFALTRQGMLAGLVPQNIEKRARFFESLPPAALPSAFSPFTNAVDLLGDGALLAVELPGHCPGHWGLAMRDTHDRYIFLLADAVWSIGAIEQLTPPPRFTTAWLGNTTAYRRTLNALHRLHLHNPTLPLLPSHCIQAAQLLTEGR